MVLFLTFGNCLSPKFMFTSLCRRYPVTTPNGFPKWLKCRGRLTSRNESCYGSVHILTFGALLNYYESLVSEVYIYRTNEHDASVFGKKIGIIEHQMNSKG